MGERDHLEDLNVDWRIILTFIFNKESWGMDGFDLAQYRDKWRSLVKCGNEPSGSMKLGGDGGGEFLD